MPQLRQGVGLADDVGGDLQRDRPIGKVPLAGKVNAAEGPAPQLGLEPKAKERAAHRREAGHGPREAVRQVRVRSVEVEEQLGRSRCNSSRRERGVKAGASSPLRPSWYSR